MITVLLSLWLLVVLGVLLLHRRELAALWREPVLRRPVLIIESDDWGAGPLEQVPALQRLVALLEDYRDAGGRHPVMTLALILAVPDGPAVRADGRYHRLTLDQERFRPLLAALRDGAGRGVFALQLHGMEHYWPATLMASADPAVRRWREQDGPGLTESLPPPLQSRWIDARELPSRPLEAADIERAAAGETALFARCFGRPATVAVPPTFVWEPRVEAAWARHGVRLVITPGLRNGCRDGQGAPACRSGPIRNGQLGDGVRYLVRNDYFEPERGHRAGQALEALRQKTARGRPCLLETHRSNFIGPRADAACAELARLLDGALERFPDLRFMSSEELGTALTETAGPLLEQRFSRRLRAWVKRLAELPRFPRLARWTGLMAVLRLLVGVLNGPHPDHEEQQ